MAIKVVDVIDQLLTENEVYVGSSLAAMDRADLRDIDDDDIAIDGYAVQDNEAQKDTIRPLGFLFNFDMVEQDGIFKAVRRGHDPVVTIREDAPNGFIRERNGETHQEDRTQEAEIPTEINVEYLNTDRDYQTDTASARRIVRPYPTTYNRRKETVRLPLAIKPDQAVAAAEVALYEADTQRTRYRIRLPRDYLYLVESDVVELVLKDGYTFRARIDRMDIGADLSIRLRVVQETAGEYQTTEVAPDGVRVPIRSGEGGLFRPRKQLPQPPEGPQPPQTAVVLSLLDTPLLRDADAAVVTVPPRAVGYWAGARAGDEAWRGGSLLRRDPVTDATQVAGTTAKGMTYGTAVTVLGAATVGKWSIDRVASVDVRIDGGAARMESITFERLVAGENLAILQNEIFQFLTATAIGSGRWRLSGLLRGVRGTDGLTGDHEVGDRFILLDDDSVQNLSVTIQNLVLSSSDTTTTYLWALPLAGQSVEEAAHDNFAFTGKSLYPYPPAIRDLVRSSDGSITLRWYRRPHIADPMRQLAGSPALAPGEEDDYRVRFLDPDGNLLQQYDEIAARAGSDPDKQKLVLTLSEVESIPGLNASDRTRLALSQKQSITSYGFERTWDLPITGAAPRVGPDAPSGLTATASSSTAGAVDLSWTARPGADTYEYRWRIGSGNWTVVPGITGTTATYQGTEGQAYDFQVRARNVLAAGAWSGTQSASGGLQIIPIPTNFGVASGFSPDRILMSWRYANADAAFDFRYRVGLTADTPWTTVESATVQLREGLYRAQYIGVSDVWYRLAVRARVGTRTSGWTNARAIFHR